MPRTAAGVRAVPTSRLAELEQRRPEWRSWIAMLGITERALHDGGWPPPLTEREPASTVSGSPEGEPLLHRQELRADAGRARRLVGDLAASGDLAGGSSLSPYRPSEAQALQLISAAVRQDAEQITALAAEGTVDPGALGSVAHLAALPLLQSCGRLLQDRLPSYWPHGYCPVCAAWPILAERRGLDRSRRLRCGRCASEWEVQWLCCIYCGERNHDQLGWLEPHEREEVFKVETCTTCRGYLKSIASLQAIPAFELLVQDLETVELDLVALDRGFNRPPTSGFALEVQVVDHASR